MTPFCVTLDPGNNVPQASMRLAKLIVDRWMPGNAGGVHLLVTPQMAKSLAAIWPHDRPKTLRVEIVGNRPVITECPP